MHKVPEDFQSILSDPGFFNNSSEITTKEILKKYGEIAAAGVQRRPDLNESSSMGRSKQGSGRALAPVVTRVDTDPSQVTAWQKESSVRHVQDQPTSYANPGNQSTPPQPWQGRDNDAPAPYIPRNGTPESQKENGHGRGWRNSAWARQHNGNGSMGVTDAT